MLKKSIAAALLVLMVAWAEIALAPMLAMQAGHVHPASAMAGQMAEHHHAMPAGHPCCPGLAKPENTAFFEFAASTVPCQNDHRCCFRQGPQSVPAPVSASNNLSRDLTPAEIAQLNPANSAQSKVSSATPVALSPPPSLFGMILRV